MTEEELRLIESKLNLQLPESYRRFVSPYPEEADKDIRGFILYDAPERVVAENQSHRSDGWFGNDWPEEFLVIGDTGCGDTYFMIIRKDERVYLADHDGGPDYFEQLEECLSFNSLEEHMEDALAIAKEFEEKNRPSVLKRASKKWWQFWS